jgi:TrmH family RNA methyltransferase
MSITIELLLSKPNLVRNVYIHSKIIKNQTYYFLWQLCLKNKIEIIENDKIFNILSPKENCFVIGLFNKFFQSMNPKKSHIVLVNPSNAGNLGTIFRSCKGFNISDVIIIGNSVDIYDPKVIRSSMGAIFGININYFETFKQYRNKFQKHNLYTFVLNTENYIEKMEFLTPFSLIFGNESTGLPEEYKNIGKNVTIKHSPNIDSLNLSVAVSIALFEVTKKDIIENGFYFA